MKLTWEQVDDFADRVKGFVDSLPNGQAIVDDALMMGSGDETAIVLTPQELEGNSTVCGDPDKVCFTERVTRFLVSQGVKQLVVGIIPREDAEADGYGPLVCGAAVPIPYECGVGQLVDDWRDWFPDGNQYLSEIAADGDTPTPSQVLSQLVWEFGGSWRDDNCAPGWSTYESE